MKLTIGMIVKNEEKWLDKCLSAIKPILDNVDSELIITDTGSVDKTVEIAKKYTDKVLHFDWCDDFSAARNFGLEKAQGEWFMYLDADDIFDSCDGIIEFFNSGEYKNYNSASYVGKNIVDTDGHFALNKQPRLTRILKNTRFKNVVHEVFTTYGGPKKDISDIAVHYGYMYETEEQKHRKTERNRSLLLKRLEKERNTSAFVYVQLAENEEEPDIGLKYVEEGIKTAKKLNDISMIPLMKHKSNFYLLKKDYEKSLSACNEYFKLGRTFRSSVLTTDMEILAMKAWDHYCLKQYNDAVDTYIKFFDIYEKVRSGQLNTPESDILTIQVAAESNYLSHVVQFINSASETGQFELADTFIKKLDVCEYLEGASHIDKLIDAQILILDHFRYDRICDYLQKYDADGKNLFCKKLERISYYSPERNNIIAFLKTVPGFGEKAEIIEKYFNGCYISLTELMDHANKYGLDNNPDIIMIAMVKQYDISYFLINNSNLKKCIDNGYKHYYGFHKAVDNYDVNNIKTAALNEVLYFIKYCMEATVDFKSPKPRVYIIINANRLIEKFGMIGKRIEQDDLATSSEIIQASTIMGKALDHRNNKQYRECIAELKNVVCACGSLAKFVSDYSNEVIAEYNEVVKSQSREMNEMEKLAITIKGNIRKFIASGNIAAAQKTLADYKAIAPNDIEIPKLEAEINSKN